MEQLTQIGIIPIDNSALKDVEPFVKNPKELDIWSNDYFLQLANMIKFVT